MNTQSIKNFMGEFMTPERVDPNNFEAFATQIQITFPHNDHIRESIIAIRNGEFFESIVD